MIRTAVAIEANQVDNKSQLKAVQSQLKDNQARFTANQGQLATILQLLVLILQALGALLAHQLGYVGGKEL